MNAIVIYYSKTGFSRTYAKWISEELCCEAVSYEDREKVRLENYDTVIFGGGFHAGSINGLKWFKGKIPDIKGKKIVVFGTGAMPLDAPDTEKAMRANFSEEEYRQVKTFYLWGGLSYEKMGFGDKLMMAVFRKMLKMQGQDEQLKMVSSSYDRASREYLAPLLDFCKR